ncbi:MAG TPA: biotin/lipoyl-binding protein, partial [Planctomycetota bacterium]|nr:biotin/lipoyl-binding protein [Planctomycetota bacterium]
MTRWIPAVLLLAIAGGSFVAAREGACAADPVAAASERPAPVGLRAEGRVACYPGEQVDVGSEVGGRLVAVNVAEKAEVKKGEVLVEVEASERKAALAEARASLAEAEAERKFRERDLERLRAARKCSAISDQVLDAAERDLGVASARRDLAAASVERLAAVLEKTRVL